MNILDTDVPDINVEILKPQITSDVRKITSPKPKIASVIRKNANEIAEWILEHEPIIKSVYLQALEHF